MLYGILVKCAKDSLRKAAVLLVMSILIICSGCSTKTQKIDANLFPPETLLVSCIPPKGENDTLEWLKKGNTQEAAIAHVTYVLDVRDVIGMCNLRLESLRKYYKRLKESL